MHFKWKYFTACSVCSIGMIVEFFPPKMLSISNDGQTRWNNESERKKLLKFHLFLLRCEKCYTVFFWEKKGEKSVYFHGYKDIFQLLLIVFSSMMLICHLLFYFVSIFSYRIYLRKQIFRLHLEKKHHKRFNIISSIRVE